MNHRTPVKTSEPAGEDQAGATHIGSPAGGLQTCCLDTRCMFGLQSPVCSDTVRSPADEERNLFSVLLLTDTSSPKEQIQQSPNSWFNQRNKGSSQRVSNHVSKKIHS